MIVLSWNVGGLGKPEKRLAVRKLVKRHKVDLVLLQESKVVRNIDGIIRGVWGSLNCGWDWVPSEGASGGLISFMEE